jgi:hypothetical protein
VRDIKKKALDDLRDTWRREAHIFAGVKEVYSAVGLLRDQGMGLPKGARMNVADPAYLDSLSYVAGAFKPFVEVLATKTPCSSRLRPGALLPTPRAGNWVKLEGRPIQGLPLARA